MPPIQQLNFFDDRTLVVDENLKELTAQLVKIDLVAVVPDRHHEFTLGIEFFNLLVQWQTEEIHLYEDMESL